MSSGVELIWIINPDAQMIYLYDDIKSVNIFTKEDKLIIQKRDLADFSLILSDIFLIESKNIET